MKQSIIGEKSFLFSLQVVQSYKTLVFSKKEYVLSKQFLRSGTSVGANVSEALYGQSSKDFISKLSIARKEANETKYWVQLLKMSAMMNEIEADQLLEKCEELLRMLTAIILTTRSNS